ncbi:MAG: gluconokinase [Acidobacteriota bacterium]|jgi:gluconokinase|nr:gluconokinase [Acidobacteriota bacterium]
MVVVLMGVTGSGKTTIGRLLSKELGWTFYDADDFHTRANVEKMQSGTPLTDDDRRPWLEALSNLIRNCLERGEPAVLACSALKESYRKFLLIDNRVKLIYLKGDYAIIQKRLSERRGHYMNPVLLDSQMETLEEPKTGLQVDISLSPDEIVKKIKTYLGM